MSVDNPEVQGFKSELSDIINKYGIDNITNIPDFILANYIWNSIVTVGSAKTRLDEWEDKNGANSNRTIPK